MRPLVNVASLALLIVCLTDADHEAHAACTVGALEDDCTAEESGSTKEETFFCTDRYQWGWSEDMSQLPQQRSDSACVTMDEDVAGLPQTTLLLFGGCNATFQNITGYCTSLATDTLSFDTVTDTLEEKQPMPIVRFRAAMVNASNYVYFFGGRDLDDGLVCEVNRYDAVLDEWVTLGEQTTSCLSDHAGVASDDGSTIFLFGGWNTNYTSLNTVVKVAVDGDKLTFSESTNMTQDRGDHVCARWPATNDVYCMGGFTEIDGNFTILSSVEKFDMSTEEWEARADMVQPRADFAVGVLHDRITVVGGENEDGPMDDIEWYDPVEDCWTDSGSLFDLPYERLRYCGATLPEQQRIYIFGGQSLPAPDADNYTVDDTVNWYQEVLADELTAPGDGVTGRLSARSPAFAVGVSMAAAAIVALLQP